MSGSQPYAPNFPPPNAPPPQDEKQAPYSYSSLQQESNAGYPANPPPPTGSPYPPSGGAPYPTGSPYPPTGGAPYPTGSPYPASGGYPPTGGVPYPTGSQYPPNEGIQYNPVSNFTLPVLHVETQFPFFRNFNKDTTLFRCNHIRHSKLWVL